LLAGPFGHFFGAAPLGFCDRRPRFAAAALSVEVDATKQRILREYASFKETLKTELETAQAARARELAQAMQPAAASRSGQPTSVRLRRDCARLFVCVLGLSGLSHSFGRALRCAAAGPRRLARADAAAAGTALGRPRSACPPGPIDR
jgi:hypothetical protein